MRSTAIILTDNRAISESLRSNPSDGRAIHAKPVLCCGKEARIEPGDIQAFFQGEADIALIMKNSLLKEYTNALNRLGVYHLFVYPYDIQLNGGERLPQLDDLMEIDNTKPRLSFLDIEITQHCSLKCKGCLDFSNLVTEKAYLDIELFKKNLLPIVPMWN